MDPEFLLRELLETGRRVVSAIEHHQISLQSVWEGIDSIENAISQLADIAERFDTRDEEQFRWRVEARIKQYSMSVDPKDAEEISRLRKAV